MARNYGSVPKWESGVVVEKKGPLSYTVQLNPSILWCWHIDQLCDGVPVTSGGDEVDVSTGSSSHEQGAGSAEEESSENTELVERNTPNGVTLSNSTEERSGHGQSNNSAQSEWRYPSRDCMHRSKAPKVHVKLNWLELNIIACLIFSGKEIVVC